MRRLFARFRADRAGATALEFALVAGPFILLLLGSLEFGRVLWSQHSLQQVAGAAARCAAIPQPSCAVNGVFDPVLTQAMIDRLARDYGLQLQLQAQDIAVTRGTTCGGLSGFTQVALTYRFQTPVQPLIAFMSEGIVLHAEGCYPTG